MPLSDIVSVTITATTTSPTREGFGTPLIAAYHNVFAGRTAEYGSLSEMVAAGFTTGSASYLCATKVFSQNPRVKSLKVGRRAHSFTQLLDLTCLSATAGDVYSFKVGGKQITRTVPGSSSVNAEAIAIKGLIDGFSISGLTVTNPGAGVIHLAMTAGLLVDVQTDKVHLSLADVTADAGGSSGIADDLAAIVAVDNTWYGLLLDSNSPAEILAAAAWAEANKKLFVTNASDTGIAVAATTTDVASTLKTAAYGRTALLFSESQLLSYSGAAWMGNRFPFDPGSDTWAFKTLKGVSADTLNDGQVHAVENKKANVYTAVAGVNITQFGVTPSGEFVDTVRFIDWLTSELQTSVFGLLANNAKIPFTDAGIDAIRSTILGVLGEGINVGGLAADPAPVVTMPKAADVDATNKAARNLPNVFFTATLAGAVHTLAITGTLSV